MIVLIFNSILLGVGLAMDAFSVSLANGLNEPNMKGSKRFLIAGIFAVFQGLMPMIGWFLVTRATEFFVGFQRFIPYIAFVLLAFIGGKMILDSYKQEAEGEESVTKELTLAALLVQGVATSIDALSVGFTISEYSGIYALISSTIIAVVTFVICFAGIIIGKKVGTKLASKASILGGVILFVIGLEILIKGILT